MNIVNVCVVNFIILKTYRRVENTPGTDLLVYNFSQGCEVLYQNFDPIMVVPPIAILLTPLAYIYNLSSLLDVQIILCA